MVVEHLTWDWLAALGMTFGGLGGGAFLVAAITSLCTGSKYRELLKLGAYLAASFAILDLLMLAAELGHPERALYIYSNPSSMVTIGGSILMVFIILGIIYITFLPPDSLPWLRSWFPWYRYTAARNFIEVIGIPFAVGTSYTGVLLAVASAKPFWNTPVLPALFFLSAVLTGVMAIGLLLSFLYPTKLVKEEKAILLSTLHKVSISGIFLGIASLAVALFYLLMTLSSPSPLAVRSAKLLVEGLLSPMFIGGFVVVGLVIPILLCGYLIHMKKKKADSSTVPLLMAAGSICVIIGNILMRYAILAAGQLVTL